MAGLLDEIKTLQSQSAARYGGKSIVQRLMDDLPKSDRADLLAAILDPSISAALIGKVLRSKGHKLSDSAISLYRNGLKELIEESA